MSASASMSTSVSSVEEPRDEGARENPAISESVSLPDVARVYDSTGADGMPESVSDEARLRKGEGGSGEGGGEGGGGEIMGGASSADASYNCSTSTENGEF